MASWKTNKSSSIAVSHIVHREQTAQRYEHMVSLPVQCLSKCMIPFTEDLGSIAAMTTIEFSSSTRNPPLIYTLIYIPLAMITCSSIDKSQVALPTQHIRSESIFQGFFGRPSLTAAIFLFALPFRRSYASVTAFCGDFGPTLRR